MKRAILMFAPLLALGFALALGANARVTIGTLEGTVLTSRGEPAAGATVVMQTSDGEHPNAARTDSEDRFRFERYETGEYDLRASDKGRYSEWTKHVRIRSGKVTTVDLRLTEKH